MFESHAKHVLRTYLNPWAKKIEKINLSDYNSLDNDFSALIIDDRPDEMLRFSVINTLWMTRFKIPINIYTTRKSLLQTRELFLDIENKSGLIKINILEIDKIDINSYNNLLKSHDFWGRLETQKVLIFQTDAMLIEPIELSMFNFDYIGALFSKGKSRSLKFPCLNNELLEEIGSVWVNQKYNEDLPSGILMGNGGLSIRNRDIMKKICLEETADQKENEDIFFSRFIKKYSSKIPKMIEARNFSIEADYHYSSGFHGSYYYLQSEELSNIYDRHIKNVIAIASSLYKYSFLGPT